MLKVALIGNPNTGKSSIYNLITGGNQATGNYTGVTVNLQKTRLHLSNGENVELIDFPGTYSIYPSSKDEEVVFNILSNPNHEDYPDLILVVANATQLYRSLLLFLQIHDLNIPLVLLSNMSDKLRAKGLKINYPKLQEEFPEVPILPCNARLKSDKAEILKQIENYQNIKAPQKIGKYDPIEIANHEDLKEQDTQIKSDLALKIQQKVLEESKTKNKLQEKVDRFLVHPFWGYFTLLVILFFIFQMIFNFAEIPMDWIDEGFAYLSFLVQEKLPPGVLNDLLSEGIIPGIGGIVIFVPQIALLFLFISILEESGYMSRAVFIMDRLMRPLGLSGRSVVPLMSSVACAIPGIMSARSISSWKNRLITILVAPFMSCSARIPVYTLLIALVIPDKNIFGFINLKGLTLLFLYLLGTFMALFTAWVLKFFIKAKGKDFFMMELPSYNYPSISNILRTVGIKTKEFVWGAGKIILTISIILWALASYGPDSPEKTKELNALEKNYENKNLDEKNYQSEEAAIHLKYSYVGIFGRKLQPGIEPLGYDWKMGIALITSFAAREVFVGTLNTIYSIGESMEPGDRLIHKMRKDKKADGSPVYSFATGMSLMIFYAFAMQCMATLAIVKKETQSWKWAIGQLIGMTTFAYLAAWLTYTLLS